MSLHFAKVGVSYAGQTPALCCCARKAIIAAMKWIAVLPDMPAEDVPRRTRDWIARGCTACEVPAALWLAAGANTFVHPVFSRNAWCSLLEQDTWPHGCVLDLDDTTPNMDAALDEWTETAIALRWTAEARACDITLRWSNQTCTPGRICDLIETINSPRIRWELPAPLYTEALQQDWIHSLNWRLGSVMVGPSTAPEPLLYKLAEIGFDGTLRIPSEMATDQWLARVGSQPAQGA